MELKMAGVVILDSVQCQTHEVRYDEALVRNR